MRPAYAHIDLAALRHNYQLAKQFSPNKALAVVKADAYGHGAVQCAQALTDCADGFAVACLEEAIELRSAGIKQPILLLEGFFHADELALCVEHDLWLVIHAHWQIEALTRSPLKQPINCWLKMDSGMHRVGFFLHDFVGAYQRLRQCANVGQVVAMTHLARADDVQSPAASQQCAVFSQAIKQLGVPTSLSNSAAVLAWPQIVSDWTRPGIMLYGSNPLLKPTEVTQQLKPVMSLQSRIIAVRELPEGEAIGYGARFVTQKASRIGVVAMGYADGYPRHAQDGTPMLVEGHRAGLAGRVSMDMLTVDLTDLPQAGVGSAVELWGKHISVDEVAHCADTISYSMLTNIKRVQKNYLNADLKAE
ncbi:alanine racemase [Thiopseudomonas acetoxidans]|uniref:Alanine racemase n=1 Tax=Thiopseudomonas acetoxidans TaxID=3041622 RepID=A0ABT7SKM6_9GAMM|nr:alanine racemase [Thiopseudomonas sp. CY1220]MDM7856711.1 alanine racemase [Thiopseudomonas sp. CY1220]